MCAVVNLGLAGLQIGSGLGLVSTTVNANVAGSITIASNLAPNSIQLVGDTLGPGPSHYYGTNSLGQTGWFDLASGDVAGNLQTTGQTLYGYIVGLSGATVTATTLAATGSTLYSLLVGLSGQSNINYATVANLALTGQTLYSDLTGFSGNLNAAFASTANLAATGSTLYADIVGLSGALGSTIASTGSQAWNAANNNGANLSGNLTQTGITVLAALGTSGSALYKDLTGLSGAANSTFATQTNLTQTGITLIGLINAASAGVSSLNGLSGVLNLASSGYLTFATGAGTITIGVTGLASAVALASTGQQAWSAAQSNAVNLSGALTQTGITLIGLINAASAGVSSLNGLSGMLTLGSSGYLTFATGAGAIMIGVTGLASAAALASTGQQAWSAAQGNATNLSGNLTQTGVAILAALSSYATAVNLTSTGQTLYVDLTGLSGALNTAVSATGSLILGVLGSYATTTNLASTGAALFNDITGLSGAHNAAIASTGQQAWLAAQNDATNLSGNLTQTGVAILNALSSYATTTSLTNTGAALCSDIAGLSGVLNSTAVFTTGNQTINGNKTFAGSTTFTGAPTAVNYFMAQSGVTQTSATVTLDFTYGTAVQTITITGATLLTGANYAAGHAITLRILPTSTGYALSFASGWSFIGNAAPTGTVSGQVGVLSMQCFDTTDTGVIAAYAYGTWSSA